MKNLLLSAITVSLFFLTASNASAEDHQHQHGNKGDHSEMSLESRKAQMLIRMEQRKQCVISATSFEELNNCKGKGGKKGGDHQRNSEKH
jgi:hypothetical protein